MAPDRPHVLLVHAHDLGRYLGCYGADVETPNVDRLAENGARFTDHFTTAPQCSPSRGSLLTGNYPHEIGMLGLAHHDWGLGPEDRPLPARLAGAGYDTHLFGLQHVTPDPSAIGFETVHTAGGLSPGVTPGDHERNRARDVAPIVAEFLDGDHETPFFASVGFFETHLVPGEEYFGFGEGYDRPDPSTVAVPAYLPDVPAVRADLAGMHGMIHALDEAVGVVLDALESAGLTGETVVVFTTEHGIPFPRAKGMCYDPGIEAALLVQYPPVVEAGLVSEALLSNVDVLPTILELATGDPPADVAGRSFSSLLAGGSGVPRERLFAEITWHDAYNPIRAVRTDRHKYVRNCWHLPEVYLPNDVYRTRSGQELCGDVGLPGRPFEELYDLETDPHERRNVATDGAYGDVRRELESDLGEWMHRTADPLLDGPVEPTDYGEIMAGLR